MKLAQTLEFDTGNAIGLETINFPVFLSLEQAQNFSFYSYIGLALSLVFVVLALIWVGFIVRASVEYISSQGDAEKINTSMRHFGNSFWSITFLFGFFVVLSLVAIFLGLGTFWQWPQRLSSCTDGSLYFTKALENPSLTPEEIDVQCFSGTDVRAICLDRCRPLVNDAPALNACLRECRGTN